MKITMNNGEIVNVGVVAYHKKDGRIQPMFIVWEDEYSGDLQKYKIEQITKFEKTSRGHCVWNVIIHGKNILLHYNGSDWYTVRM